MLIKKIVRKWLQRNQCSSTPCKTRPRFKWKGHHVCARHIETIMRSEGY